MSIEIVRNGRVVPKADWSEAFSEAQYARIVPVKTCCICGDGLLNNHFVFWRGHVPMGFHAHCARHMCLGLLRDVAELTGTLAHEGHVIEQPDKSAELERLTKACEESQKLVAKYSSKIIELQNLLAQQD